MPTTVVVAGVIAGAVASQQKAAEQLLLKKKMLIMKKIRKKNKEVINMYEVAISLMGRECKVLTIMGVVPGVVTEVTDTTITLMHKHYKQIINLEYVISITEKVIA